MAEVFRSPLAELDLLEIWFFIAEDNKTRSAHAWAAPTEPGYGRQEGQAVFVSGRLEDRV